MIKQFILLSFYVCFAIPTNAQLSKIVNIKAGDLSSAIKWEEHSKLTNLTIKGFIDARDFKTMRDSLPYLSTIDLSEAKIVEYLGTNGTGNCVVDNPDGSIQFITIVITGTDYYHYIANQIPRLAFRGKRKLTSVILPSTITLIDEEAFKDCRKLLSITIPQNVDTIMTEAFSGCPSLSFIKVHSVTPVNLSNQLDVFQGLNMDSCILKVPLGAKVNYTIADQWKDFRNIREEN